jgi:hypothetical protein
LAYNSYLPEREHTLIFSAKLIFKHKIRIINIFLDRKYRKGRERKIGRKIQIHRKRKEKDSKRKRIGGRIEKKMNDRMKDIWGIKIETDKE